MVINMPVYVKKIVISMAVSVLFFLGTGLSAFATAPVVTISLPGDGSESYYGNRVDFVGSAVDDTDGDAISSYSWTSDLDGALSTSATFNSTTLSIGVHIIKLFAIDDNATPETGFASVTITIKNNNPAAAITAPLGGATSDYGTGVTFTGTGTDTEDGILTGASLSWSSNRDGVIGTGLTFATSTLSSGPHTVTLTVTDSHGGTGSAAVTVNINNTAPTAVITSPANGITPSHGDLVTFQGTGTDPEEGALTGTSLVWTSSQGDAMGSGATIAIDTLTSGTHVITLTATDSKGASHSDTITITVGNAPPQANITAPSDGSSYDYHEYITFNGTGIDPEDGSMPGSALSWTRTTAGTTVSIGTGVSVSVNDFPSGTHTVTLTVTDTGSATATASISVTVGNASPTATITSPANESSHVFGSSVTFTGTGTDPEDGSLTGSSLSWSSSRDGFLGTGVSISKGSLSVGSHVITLTVTDSDNVQAATSINISVGDEPPTSVSISKPSKGDTFYLNDYIEFQGSASDNEDGELTGSSLVWTSTLDGSLSTIGEGNRFLINTLPPGEHLITLTATDCGGGTKTEFLTITVENRLPQVVITMPASVSSYVFATAVIFTGSATDPEDGELTGSSLSWSSDRDGVLGTGTSVSKSDLSVGTHVISLTSTDSSGGESSASITITINDDESPATVIILSPLDGDTFYLNDYIEFCGIASDNEEGELTGSSLIWTSDLEKSSIDETGDETGDKTGKIGEGLSFSVKDLSKGEHLITLTATDSNGSSISTFIVIEVENQLPVPKITFPAEGSSFNQGDDIDFRAAVTDPEDIILTGNSLVWKSDIDGMIGVGVSPSKELSPGEHTIVLTAQDSHGGVAADQISLSVTATEQSEALTLKKDNVFLDKISLNLDQTEKITISGGIPSYRIETGYPELIYAKLDGNTITIEPKEIGTITLLVFDHNEYELPLEITVMPNSGDYPVAKAGLDRNVLEGDTVTLDGSSSLPGSYGILSWNWTQISGNINVVLSDTLTEAVTFVAPSIAESLTLTFQLTVTDNNGSESSDEVIVNIDDNGITQYPGGVTTFKSADTSNKNLGVNIVGDGDFVELKAISSKFNYENVNRPENMIYDLMDFKIKVDNPGDGANFVIYLPESLGADYSCYKYSTTKGWYLFSGNIEFDSERTKVYIRLVDGGIGDDDGIENGIITDPLTFGTAPLEIVEPPAPDGGSGGGGGGGCFISTLFK